MFPEIRVSEVRPVVPEWYNEIYAVHKLGYVWMAFDGRPTRSHPRYWDDDVREHGMRVRQLMSPEQLADERWKTFFEAKNGAPADGSEPLGYTYESSGCSAAMVPDLVSADLAVDMSRLVHNECESVPHDIGIKLANIVRQHFTKALD